MCARRKLHAFNFMDAPEWCEQYIQRKSAMILRVHVDNNSSNVTAVIKIKDYCEHQ
jgi:hypothetical protein